MKTKTTIFGLAAVSILAMAAIVFAHGGYGGGHWMRPGYEGHMMGPDYGRGHMMGWHSDDRSYCSGYAARGSLSDEDAAKLDESRANFYAETRALREQIDEKEMALRREMDRANPEQEKIFELQKEISSLRSDFDQKAIAHQMEVRRLLPDNYRGSGYGRGYCW